jgi:adenine-specific DNA-methyltransferase
MAYVKQWAPRSANPLQLRVPELLAGGGRAVQGDALELAPTLGSFDLAYLDPPYNQHRYFTNYHVWETLVAWDAPEPYGVARKRIDARDPATRSAFNSKRTMPDALRSVVRAVDCELLVLSYNDESWLAVDELEALCSEGRSVATLAFDSARYVGARIGIFDPSGVKVGRVSHLSNQELLVIAGEKALVQRVVEAVGALGSASGVRSRAGSATRTKVGGPDPHAGDRLQ